MRLHIFPRTHSHFGTKLCQRHKVTLSSKKSEQKFLLRGQMLTC